MKKLVAILIFILFSPAIFAQEHLRLVASVKPLQLVASAILADLGDVDLLIPPGSSPHHYALKPSDIRLLENADLVIWVGPEMEQFLAKTLRRHDKPILQLLESDEAHDDHSGHDHHSGTGKAEIDHHHHGETDPHIWMDPMLMLEAAERIKQQLQEQAPEYFEELDSNYQQFERDLRLVDKQLSQQLKPYQDKGFVVFHDAFSLLVEHYHLNQQAFFTIDPARAPGAKKLARIEKLLKESAVSCVFVEPQFETVMVERIVADMPIKIGRLDPLATNVSLAQGYTGYLQQMANSIEHCLK